MTNTKMTTDRRVHAINSTGNCELVRYDRAGKWYLETKDLGRHPATLKRAVELAIYWHATGGTVFLGLPGGRSFDRPVAQAIIDRAESLAKERHG